jgi:tetratricopeptide (TPR) repeat protein
LDPRREAVRAVDPRAGPEAVVRYRAIMRVRAFSLAVVMIGTMTPLVCGQATVAEVEAASNEHLKRGDAAGAIVILDRALAKWPNEASLWWRRAFAKGRSGDFRGGIEDATRVIELAPQDVRGWIERGYLRGQKGELTAALADFDRAAEIAPDEPTVFGDRGDVKQKLGDWFGARADYDRALVLQPTFGAARHNRAVVAMMLCAWSAAAEDQRAAIAQTPPMARMWEVLAEAEEHLGRHDEAVRCYTRALELAPESPIDVALLRAKANLARGRTAAARSELTRLTSEPAAAGEQRGMLYQWLGGVLLHSGKLEQAKNAFERAAADPGILPFAAFMQWCAASDDAAAAKTLRETIAAIPAPDSLQMDLVALCAGERPPAELAAAVPFPMACFTWYLAAWRASKSGDEPGAQACFRRCLNTGDKRWVQWHLARVQLGLATSPAVPGKLGLSLRAVPDVSPPQLEITAVDADGPAALQHLVVGTRILEWNDQPATPAAVSALEPTLVVGTTVRLLVVDGDKRVERWLVAGVLPR